MQQTDANLYNKLCTYLSGGEAISPFNGQLADHPLLGIFSEIKMKSSRAASQIDAPSLSLEKIEMYFEKYLAGNLNKEDVEILKDAICSSEKIFSLIMKKIKVHEATITGTAKNIPTDWSRSDEELANKMFYKEEKNQNELVLKERFVRKNTLVINAILTAAAIFLVLFLLPIEFQQNLDELYSFDTNVPLGYEESGLRGSVATGQIHDPDYKLFRQIFKEGMASYLVKDYGQALKEWQKISAAPSLRNKMDEFPGKEKEQLNLYRAMSFLGLALSVKDEPTKDEKKESLIQAINLFRAMDIKDDTTKYYYALSLALNNNADQARTILKGIIPKSKMFQKRVVLEERLNQ
jgi:hypothetical protein